MQSQSSLSDWDVEFTALSAAPGSIENCDISQPFLACCLPKGFKISNCTIKGSRGSWVCGRKYKQTDVNRKLGFGMEACTIESFRLCPIDPLSGGRYTNAGGVISDGSNFQSTVVGESSEVSDEAFARALLQHQPRPRGTDMATFGSVRRLIAGQYDPDDALCESADSVWDLGGKGANGKLDGRAMSPVTNSAPQEERNVVTMATLRAVPVPASVEDDDEE